MRALNPKIEGVITGAHEITINRSYCFFLKGDVVSVRYDLRDRPESFEFVIESIAKGEYVDKAVLKADPELWDWGPKGQKVFFKLVAKGRILTT